MIMIRGAVPRHSITGRARRRRIGCAKASAAGSVGGLAAAEEAAEGLQAGGRAVRCRPFVEGAAG